MILNLFADSPDPDSLKTQINASLMELARGLNESLVGQVIDGDSVSQRTGVIQHDLGVKPLVVLRMSGSNVIKAIKPSPRVVFENNWTTTTVPIAPPSPGTWYLIIGKLGD